MIPWKELKIVGGLGGQIHECQWEIDFENKGGKLAKQSQNLFNNLMILLSIKITFYKPNIALLL